MKKLPTAFITKKKKKKTRDSKNSVLIYLKDFAGDKALAVVAFDAKLTLIIFLAVRESIPT